MKQKFETLDLPAALPEALIETLHELEFTTMTEIQEKSLPMALSGKDVIAQAKTGSGKTAAFGIPLVMKADVTKRTPQGIVLCPTRELAEQVAKALRQFGRWKKNLKILTLSGGMPMRPQMSSLEHGAHIVVGTPGRILDHLGKRTLKLDNIETVVLDEADRMLDMGFHEDIEKILSRMPRERQTLLFSATFPPETEAIAQRFMKQPVRVKALSEHAPEVIEEHFFEVPEEAQEEALVKILQLYQPESAIVFANTKVEVMDLTDLLRDAGFSALDLHGDLEQYERTETLLQFANRSIRIVVATDVAARGLDIDSVEMVVNYGLPRKKEDYIHRTGRTGRAGKRGKAVTLLRSAQKRKLSEFTALPAESLDAKAVDETVQLKAAMKTIAIRGGKKNKLRAGDILGTLCKEIGLSKNAVGKIDIFDFDAYVAVEKGVFRKALEGLQRGKIKNRKFKVREL